MLKIIVVGLVDTVTDELGSSFFGGHAEVVILEEEGVGEEASMQLPTTGVALSWMVRS